MDQNDTTTNSLAPFVVKGFSESKLQAPLWDLKNLMMLDS